MADNGAWGASNGLIGGILGALGSGLGWGSASFEKDAASAASRTAYHRMLYMSNTAYQRARHDLEEAGLNPMLAYTQGGASSGAVAPAATPRGDFSGDVAGGFSKGMSAARELQMMKDRVGTVSAQRKAAEAEASSAVSRSITAANEAEGSKYLPQSLYQDYRNKVMQEGLIDSQRSVNAASTAKMHVESDRISKDIQRVIADTSWIAARDRRDRLATPYSPEQIDLVKKHTPLIGEETKDALKRLQKTREENSKHIRKSVRRFLEKGSAAAKDFVKGAGAAAEAVR